MWHGVLFDGPYRKRARICNAPRGVHGRAVRFTCELQAPNSLICDAAAEKIRSRPAL